MRLTIDTEALVLATEDREIPLYSRVVSCEWDPRQNITYWPDGRLWRKGS